MRSCINKPLGVMVPASTEHILYEAVCSVFDIDFESYIDARLSINVNGPDDHPLVRLDISRKIENGSKKFLCAIELEFTPYYVGVHYEVLREVRGSSNEIRRFEAPSFHIPEDDTEYAKEFVGQLSSLITYATRVSDAAWTEYDRVVNEH